MAHKQKGLLTNSGEWAKHLRGFLKRQFWKGERRASKKMIEYQINELPSLEYNNQNVFEFNNDFKIAYQLIQIEPGNPKWRTFYENYESNWISFYPFSEYHGGGKQYIIMIGQIDFKKWLENNHNFENEIRELLEK